MVGWALFIAMGVAYVVTSSSTSIEPFRASLPAVVLLLSNSEIMLDMAVSSTDLLAPALRGDFAIVFQSCLLPLIYRPFLLLKTLCTGSRVEFRSCLPVDSLAKKSSLKPCVEKGRAPILALPMVKSMVEE